MNHARWLKLMNTTWHKPITDDMENLTQEEIDQGWHFCPDWDDLLIGPGMEEIKFCECGEEKNEPTQNGTKSI